MKKIYFLAGAVAALVAVSCAKEQGKVDKPSPTPEVTEEEDATPVPILFGSKLNIVETKAAVEKWNDAHTPQSNALYIYGLEEDGNAYKLTSKKRAQATVQEAFINNVKAIPPAGATAAANSQRLAIVVNNPDAADPVNAPEPFYYAEAAQYNFFGYYVDDAAGDYTDPNAIVNPAPTVTANEGIVSSITLDVKINGTQDILLAKTDKEDDLINKDPNNTKPIASTNKLYSAYSARRGVNPNLNFEHQLSRFVFSIKKGGNVESNKITIDSLKVESFTTGTLTIVGSSTPVSNQSWNDVTKQFGEVDSKQNLFLVPSGERSYLPVTTLDNDTPIIKDNTLNIHPTDTYIPIGDIMVYPGQDVYNFDLGIKQTGITAGIPTQHLQIEMAKVIKNGASAGVQFAEPGKQYNVNLIVYGAEEVVITVTLTDWDEVGEIEIDPDEQDEIDSYVPTLSFAADEIVAGATTQATVSVTKNAEPVTTGLAITYESKNPNVATVSETGLVTGVAAGTAKIVAKIAVTVNIDNEVVALGTIIAAKDITVTAAPLPTAVVTAHTDVSAWTFVANYAGTIATISGSATVNDEPVTEVCTYSVDENDLLQVDAATGFVTLKDGATNPTQDTEVTFTATLANKAGVYNGASKTVTITVHRAS